MTPELPRRPSATEADAARLAEDLYGFEQVDIRELPADSDRNFRLKVGDHRYVLKISRGGDHRSTLEIQGKVLEHLEGVDLGGAAAPTIVPGQDGGKLYDWVDADERPSLVRLVSWIEGRPMGDVRPHPGALFEEIGHVLGRLDRSLVDFDPGDLPLPVDRVWDLAHSAETVAERLGAVPDAERRALAEAVLRDHAEHVVPILPELPRSMIHGDANDYNLLVRVERGLAPELVGVIDFGDMVFSQRVNEVAIAGAYAIFRKSDPLGILSRLVAGYHAELPFDERELSVLFHLVRLRLSTSACMAAHQRALEPDNEYLSISEAPAWQALERLAQIHPRFAHYTLRSACGLPAAPATSRLRTYLESHRGSFGKLVDGDPESAVVVDLSVSSSLLASLDDPTDPAALDRRVMGILAETEADFAYGRWDEPRLLYAGGQFADTVDSEGEADGDAEPPERRTVHVGIDLFQAAGSPVYAPMDGIVHSLADNDLPFDYGGTLVLRHRYEADGNAGEGAESDDGFYSLYGHLSKASIEGKFEGMVVKKGDLLGHLGEIPENGGWAPHLHYQLMVDMLDRYGEFPGVAAPTLRRLWCDLCPDPGAIVGVPGERFPAPEPTAEEILDQRRTSIGPNLSISYRRHLHMVAGRGQFLYDAEGRTYLDSVNNVPHVGHCHPRVVAAAAEQKAVLETNTRYLHPDLVRYAERLKATLPDPLSVIFFTCTGSEANDLALRLARIHTGHRDVICVEGAYHGHTASLIAISPYKYDGPGGPGAPDSTLMVPLPCGYRGEHKWGEPELGARFADSVREACAVSAERGTGAAAFICESVLGCGGQVVLPEGYFEAAYSHARAAGAVTIADEVQVGFGRVGSHFWAFETQGVVPDIVTIGKPIGNGHPMAAVITTEAIASSFANGMEYFNTFGGNPASCRVGQAVLDVIEDQGLQENARVVGEHLLNALRPLKERHALIGEVRGIGLFVGIELVRDHETLEPADTEASYIANRMRDHRILISTDGPWHNVLKIKPPIVYTEADADRLVSTLDRILGEDPVRLG